MIVLDRDIPVGSRVPVDNGLVDFKAQESGRVLVPREEIRGYDVVYRPDGEKMPASFACLTKLPLAAACQ